MTVNVSRFIFERNFFDSVQLFFLGGGSVVSKMENKKKHFRHALLFHCRNSENAVQARKKLCKVYGEDVSFFTFGRENATVNALCLNVSKINRHSVSDKFQNLKIFFSLQNQPVFF